MDNIPIHLSFLIQDPFLFNHEPYFYVFKQHAYVSTVALTELHQRVIDQTEGMWAKRSSTQQCMWPATTSKMYYLIKSISCYKTSLDSKLHLS